MVTLFPGSKLNPCAHNTPETTLLLKLVVKLYISILLVQKTDDCTWHCVTPQLGLVYDFYMVPFPYDETPS